MQRPGKVIFVGWERPEGRLGRATGWHCQGARWTGWVATRWALYCGRRNTHRLSQHVERRALGPSDASFWESRLRWPRLALPHLLPISRRCSRSQTIEAPGFSPLPLDGDSPNPSRGLALATLPHVAALVAPSVRVRMPTNLGTRQGLSRATPQSRGWA